MLKCVIFDLDGVLVSTDEYHYLAWKTLADRLEIPFDRTDNLRQRGVSRMDSLEILLEKSSRSFSAREKQELAEEKNRIYREYLKNLSPEDCLPGAEETLKWLRSHGILTSVGSSSCNTPDILRRTGLDSGMEAVVSGQDITHSKPHPEVFAKACTRSGCIPEECLVIEDADTGLQAGKAAGIRVMAVGPAAGNPAADFAFASLAEALPHWQEILSVYGQKAGGQE